MTETPGNKENGTAPSLEELARRLLDLWQDQLTAAAANPDLAGQAARLMAAMPLPGMWLTQMGQMGMGQMGMGPMGHNSAGPLKSGQDMAKTWADLASSWMQGGAADGSREPGTRDSASPATTGAASPAATPQLGGVDLDQLRARLAGLEKRLGELDRPAKPAKAKPAKSKPAGTRRKPAAAGKGDAGTGAANPGSGSATPDDGTAG